MFALCSADVIVKAPPLLRFTVPSPFRDHLPILVTEHDHHTDEYWTLKSIEACVQCINQALCLGSFSYSGRVHFHAAEMLLAANCIRVSALQGPLGSRSVLTGAGLEAL